MLAEMHTLKSPSVISGTNGRSNFDQIFVQRFN